MNCSIEKCIVQANNLPNSYRDFYPNLSLIKLQEIAISRVVVLNVELVIMLNL